jgi:uncharacterized coiled-coil DUF342 family protein
MNETGEQTREDLRRTTKEQAEHIGALRQRLDFLTARTRELEADLDQANAELASCSGQGHARMDAAIRECDQRLALLNDQLRAANQTIQMMQSTRVWRLGDSYWRTRSAVKRLFGRA